MNKPNYFSTKVDIKVADKLKEDLIEQGFLITQPQYTIFSAKKKNLTCTLYQSGSLMVQGKEMAPFIEFYLEPTVLQDFQYTYPLSKIDLTPRIGVDEAGKGDFFGPLSVAGIYANEEDIKKLLSLNIRDSKKMSDQTILKVGKELKHSFTHSLIRLFPVKYNELYSKFKNLNSLLGWAHATVITELHKKTSCKNAIIDQFAGEWVVKKALEQKEIEIHLTQRHRAEEDIVVAAASILARYGFLTGMDELSQEFGITLPKGASKIVLEVGKKIVENQGISTLSKVCKEHFKTKEEILKQIN